MTSALAIGLFIAVIGGVGLIAPHLFDETSRYTVTPLGLYVAGALRIAIGTVLIRAAAASRAPRLLRVLGFLAIVAGIGTLFLGVDRAHAIVAWWSNEAPVVIRLWPALALIVGLTIVWAVNPRRRGA